MDMIAADDSASQVSDKIKDMSINFLAIYIPYLKNDLA